MPLPDLLLSAILYFFIPLWLLARFGDWLFHRLTHISATSGIQESLLHLLLAGLFLEINALILGIMLLSLLVHEATVLWDLRYTSGKRRILPGEQMIHSFQELIPLMLRITFTVGFGLNRGSEEKRNVASVAVARQLSAAACFDHLPAELLADVFQRWGRRMVSGPLIQILPDLFFGWDFNQHIHESLLTERYNS